MPHHLRTEAEAMDWLHSLSLYGIRLGLHRMERLLARLGHPHDHPGIIHVGGTNGKGSVSAALAAMLQAAGFRTGLFTSPHLERFGERIRVDGQELPPWALVPLVNQVRRAVAGLVSEGMEHPTEFEAITALAWLWFQAQRVDAVVLEVGLGGRFDSTNVLAPPLLTVVTNVSLDHTDRLGDSIEQVAWDKAGIFKPGVTAVTGATGPALAVLAAEAEAVGAPLWHVGEWSAAGAPAEAQPGLAGRMMWRRTSLGLNGGEFVLHAPERGEQRLATPLLGAHQVANAAVAAAAAQLLPPPWRPGPGAIRRGLAATIWPGRLEVAGQAPLLLLDGAHNPAGAAALARSLQQLLPDRPIDFVFTCMRDKDALGMLRALQPVCRSLTLTTVPIGRAPDLDLLAAMAADAGMPGPIVIEPDVGRAVEHARERAGAGGVVVACGSLYLVGLVRSLLLTPIESAG